MPNNSVDIVLALEPNKPKAEPSEEEIEELLEFFCGKEKEEEDGTDGS